MKQQGSLIKKLRTDRKISQAMLAEGISSRTTLSSCDRRDTAWQSSSGQSKQKSTNRCYWDKRND